MRKINGITTYYSQKNNGQVELFQDYFFRILEKIKKTATPEIISAIRQIRKRLALNISCGPTAWVDGIDSCGWPLDRFTPGEQPEDSVLMIMMNPRNVKKFLKRRNIDTTRWAYNEIPQYYEVVGQIIYKQEVCRFENNITFQKYCGYIDRGCCVMFAIPGHFLIGKGYYQNNKNFIIYNDPFREANMIMPEKTLSWGVVIFPCANNNTTR